MSDGLRPLKATLAGPHAMKALTQAGTGRVTAVFASVFYVELPGGCIAVTADDIAPGPLNLRTDWAVGDWRKTGLLVGTSTHVFKGLMRTGGLLSIDCSAIGTWHPPQNATPDERGLGAVLARLGADLTAVSPKGYGTALIDPAPPEIIAAATGLASAIEGDLSDLDWAITLLGRGPGLTPAGDDVLGGAMIALFALGHADTARALWSRLAPHANRRTNAISRALLAAAAQGLGSAGLHEALNALLSGKSRLPALADLDRIGHSSGWDAFAGVVLTFRAAITPAKAAA